MPDFSCQVQHPPELVSTIRIKSSRKFRLLAAIPTCDLVKTQHQWRVRRHQHFYALI